MIFTSLILTSVLSDPDVYRLFAFHVLNLIVFFFVYFVQQNQPKSEVFINIVSFYGEELLAPYRTNKLEDHPLSAVLHCLFSTCVTYWRPFLHQQRAEALCRGDRDELTTVNFAVDRN
jgi:hypothetical protein